MFYVDIVAQSKARLLRQSSLRSLAATFDRTLLIVCYAISFTKVHYQILWRLLMKKTLVMTCAGLLMIVSQAFARDISG